MTYGCSHQLCVDYSKIINIQTLCGVVSIGAELNVESKASKASKVRI